MIIIPAIIAFLIYFLGRRMLCGKRLSHALKRIYHIIIIGFSIAVFLHLIKI